jgi:hypothetical protein
MDDVYRKLALQAHHTLQSWLHDNVGLPIRVLNLRPIRTQPEAHHLVHLIPTQAVQLVQITSTSEQQLHHHHSPYQFGSGMRQEKDE